MRPSVKSVQSVAYPILFFLKLQLDAGLEELRFTDQIEPIQRSISVEELQPYVVRHVPVHPRRDPPESPPSHWPAVEVNVRETTDQFPGSRPTAEDGS